MWLSENKEDIEKSIIGRGISVLLPMHVEISSLGVTDITKFTKNH